MKVYSFVVLLLSVLGVQLGFAQNGKYDIRFKFVEMDCMDSSLVVDVEIKAFSDTNHFFLGGQNYRFSFTRALDNPVILQELDVSGTIVHPNAMVSIYQPHTLTGSVDTVVSYNVVFAFGQGVSVTDTAWVPIGRLGFDMVDFYQCVELRWHTKDPVDFPNTVITEVVGFSEPNVAEGTYADLNFCIFDSCDVNDPPIAVDDMKNTTIGTPVTGNVLPNDSDPDGDSLIVNTNLILLPANGGASLTVNGDYVYTPDPGFTGPDSFRYEICDDGLPSLCDQAYVLINVDSCASPSTVPLNTTYCAGDTIIVSILSVSGADFYTWDVPGDVTVLSGQLSTDLQLVIGNSGGQICVRAHTGNCQSSVVCNSYDVELAPVLIDTINGPAILCPGTTGTYSIPIQPNTISYDWTLGPGWTILSGQGTNQVEVQPDDTSPVSMLSVFTSNVCGISDTQDIQIGLETESFAGFGADSTGYFEFSFTDSSQFGQSVSWDFGDGNVSSALNPVHTYADTGLYTVCQTIIGACNSDTFCLEVYVLDTAEIVIIDTMPPSGIVLYPNPSAGELNLQFYSDKDELADYILYDIRSRIVLKGQIPVSEGINLIEMDFTFLASDYYAIYLQVGEKEYVKKFFIHPE